VRDPGIDFEKYERAPRESRPRPRRERRSRMVALIILIVAIVVLIVVGVTGGSGDGGGAGEVPFNLLPVTPQNIEGVTTTVPQTTDTTEAGDTTDATEAGDTTDAEGSGAAAAVASASTGDEVGGDSGAVTEVPTTRVAPVPHVALVAYHYVSDVPPPAGPYASGMTVRTADFEAQMRYLADNGYHTVSLGDLYLARKGLKNLPPKPIVLTFDDGGLDNYRVAFPILRKYGLTATFFVITGSVGAAGHMDWDDLAYMVAEGMTVGSHTVSHPADLTAVDSSRLVRELEDSRAAIARHLGLVPEALSYPCGRFDDRVIAAARTAGYVLAVSTNVGAGEGPEADFQIRRVRVAAFESLGDFSSSLR
jgi:peptidoglycan/xylan/chitin deacetylase (PgdA/CDA1 family)